MEMPPKSLVRSANKVCCHFAWAESLRVTEIMTSLQFSEWPCHGFAFMVIAAQFQRTKKSVKVVVRLVYLGGIKAWLAAVLIHLIGCVCLYCWTRQKAKKPILRLAFLVSGPSRWKHRTAINHGQKGSSIYTICKDVNKHIWDVFEGCKWLLALQVRRYKTCFHQPILQMFLWIHPNW